eukprot:scaffold20433_cov31-Tisochrysis_lutea.AAC.4
MSKAARTSASFVPAQRGASPDDEPATPLVAPPCTAAAATATALAEAKVPPPSAVEGPSEARRRGLVSCSVGSPPRARFASGPAE